MRLRFKLYMMILPLVIIVVVSSGVFSSFQSFTSLTRIANRHMTFKAEQLRDFIHSEWDAITNLGLHQKPEYRNAVEESFRSYASSLLRSETELIIIFDSKDVAVMQIGLAGSLIGADIPASSQTPVSLPAGWFSEQVLGKSRVGVTFAFVPFGWTVAVTELEETFFSEVRNIGNAYALILGISILFATVFLSIFLGYIIRPVERLSGTIRRITATKDLTQRIRVEVGDEIGILASDFNTMIDALQTNYQQVALSIQAEKNARQNALDREEETLQILGRLSDFRDEETGEHLKRIGSFSMLFSKLLGQSKEQQKLIQYASPLHDIGKIGIPDSTLLKPDKLDHAEFEIIKQHSMFGYNLLSKARGPYLAEGATIALTHHEKWDGSGYPAGLAGENIPLSGRIVGIVDVFDALISERRYKAAWTFGAALAYIVGERGKSFDPHLVDLFQEHFPEFCALVGN